ncbi:hydrogen peroxide-inducible genes activator [Flavobacterium oncorhynchi]|uniref:Hydrogen peroxide-inducible genes activator n=1 Tax=Flavobacterium oncorhynchi TaxID=728056 RepID=A0A226HNF8_9FLAO|nr:LysR substrate-binding domain-containing protein [Flavobacterium oncorhynchi]OXA95869.1 hydrogen peroxide-inducible genes activator [Flavobacterium oncorhynchi]
MNIQQLEYIVALDKHRHFLKASKACFITQATLSGMIKKFEEELNTSLFDRSKHPVQPTDIGKKIIAQAKIALQETNRIKEIISENTGEIKGDLRIGIIPSLAPYLLPLFIQHFMETYQDVKLIINELTTDKIKEQLKEGTIDVAILAIPLLDKDLKEETLFYEEFYHYGQLNSDTPHKKYIVPEDIDLNGLLLLEEGHCLRNQVINLCELRVKETSTLKLDYQSGSIETLKQMVDLNMGTTILPGLSTLSLNENQKTKVSTFVSPFPVREIGLVYYHHYTKKNIIDALKKVILNTIPETMLFKKDMCIIPIK